MDDRDDLVLGDRGLIVRRGLIVVAVLAVMVVVGGLVARRTGPSSGHSVAPAAAPIVDADGATAAATSPTEVARSAAIRAVAMTPAVVGAGLISRRDVVAEFATVEFGAELAEATTAQVRELLNELGQRDTDAASLELTERPVTASAERSAGGVTVRVWSVMVIAVPGAGPARQVWRTVTLRMVDVDGRWLVDDWHSDLGPTPAPAAEASFEDAATFEGPLGWASADIGVGVG